MTPQSDSAVPSSATPTAQTPAALYWLALGTFAIGTEGFMIAALLTTIATDGSNVVLSVSLTGLILALSSIALIANLVAPARAVVPMLVAVTLWGTSAWAFFPAIALCRRRAKRLLVNQFNLCDLMRAPGA